MPTSYTSILKLALPATGELSGTWGDIVNNNITSMIEEAVAGRASISTWVGASHTLTTANGVTSEARCAILDCSGAPGGAATVVCPASTKIYILTNNVTGGYAVTLKTAGGTGISVPNGTSMLLYCDGVNVVSGQTALTSLALSTPLPVTSGGTGASTLTGLLKGNGTSAFTAATSGTDYAPATSGSAILKGNGTGGFSSASAGTDYAPATSGSALLKGNGSGGFSNASAGTDYAPATSGSAILKGSGTGGFTNASAGTDYAPATSGSAILKGSGSGGFSSASAGSDYVAPGAVTTSGLTQATNKLLGRTTASTGAIEEITIGSGLTFSGGTLAAVTGGGGTVTSAAMTVPAFLSVTGSPITTSGTFAVTYSGTALPVANGGSGATTLTGIIKGNGTSAFSAATAGSDYVKPDTTTSYTATQNFYTSGITLRGSSSGVTTFTSANSSSSSYVITFPAATGTVLTTAAAVTSGQGGTGYTSYSDGQVLIGSTATGLLNRTTLTAGSGISITNGSGSITIAASGSSGTVTSVGMTVPSFLSVSGSPVTSTGTLAVTYSGTALPIANGGTGITNAAFPSDTGTMHVAATNSSTTPSSGQTLFIVRTGTDAWAIQTSTVSTSAPSGGSSGDVWYRYV